MKAGLLLPLLLRLVAARPLGVAVPETSAITPHSPPESRVIRSAAALPAHGSGPQSLAPIDNRPRTPAGTDIPSLVLASPGPIETAYLLSLPRRGREKKPAASSVAPAHDKVALVPGAPAALQQPGQADRKPTATAATIAMTGHACHGAFAAYGHRLDVPIILFVALFLLVIVKAKSRRNAPESGSLDGSTTGHKARGAIRLEPERPPRKQPLSVQAWADHSSDQGMSEKAHP